MEEEGRANAWKFMLPAQEVSILRMFLCGPFNPQHRGYIVGLPPHRYSMGVR